MPYLRILCLSLVLFLMSSNAFAEGFAMTEWGARGLSLAGGMVARADDASAVAYNPAGITQLPGVHLMAGGTMLAPYGVTETQHPTQGKRITNASRLMWFPPHAYATWQLNDDWWLGFGLFTRFGLGNQYPSNWPGRSEFHNVGLQTLSANPVIAYKVNDWLSLAVGVDLMYLTIYMENRPLALMGLENNMYLEGESWGVGMNAAAHIRFNEQWSAGLTYRSQMTHNLHGRVKFNRQGVPDYPEFSSLRDSDANATVQFPDSVALAVMWKPVPELSFEVGGIWTRWSTYNSLNIYSDAGLRKIDQKSFRDGWNFNASVEYRPLDWLALRLGYWHETPVVNEKYAEYMLPTYGRDCLTTGVGFTWDNWTLDLAYVHLWIHPLSHDRSAARAEREKPGRHGMWPGGSKNCHTDMVSVSLGYKF